MIYSRWLPSGPAPLPPPFVSGAGSDQPSDTRRSKYFLRRMSDPGRSHSAAREPFTRLEPYKVGHRLTHRLSLYRATEAPSLFRRSTWDTLRFWMMLIDEDDEGIAKMVGVSEELPDPDEWFARVR